VVAGKELPHLDQSNTPYAITFGQHARWVATGDNDGFARIFEVSTGLQFASFKHQDPVTAVALSQDGRWIATCTSSVWGNHVRIVEVTTGRKVIQPQAALRFSAPFAAAFSPDDRRIVTLGVSTAQLFDAVTAQKVWDLPHPSGRNQTSFSSDGRWIASGAQVIEAATGREISHLTYPRGTARAEYGAVPGDLSYPRGIAFSPDSRLVASGQVLNAAIVFDAATGKEILNLRHNGRVFAVAFSPNGRWLATGSEENAVIVFDIATGKEILRYPHQGFVVAVAFTQDGRALYSVSQTRTPSVGSIVGAESGMWLDRHLLYTDDLIRESCSRLTTNLSPAQWNQYMGNEPYHNTCPGLPAAPPAATSQTTPRALSARP